MRLLESPLPLLLPLTVSSRRCRKAVTFRFFLRVCLFASNWLDHVSQSQSNSDGNFVAAIRCAIVRSMKPDKRAHISTDPYVNVTHSLFCRNDRSSSLNCFSLHATDKEELEQSNRIVRFDCVNVIWSYWKWRWRRIAERNLNNQSSQSIWEAFYSASFVSFDRVLCALKRQTHAV